MTPELRSAFNEVYTVFAPYKDTLDCARKCGISRPLRYLTRADWNGINREFDMAVLLWDSTRFCHFLPRLMEWIYETKHRSKVDFEYGTWGLQDLKNRLERFGWLNWPCQEVEVLQQLLGMWTSESLMNQEENSLLVLLLDIADDLSPYFNPWLQAHPFNVALWIVKQDWHQPNSAARQWAVLPSVQEHLEKAFWASPEGDHAALCSRVIQLIESLRTLET